MTKVINQTITDYYHLFERLQVSITSPHFGDTMYLQ